MNQPFFSQFGEDRELARIFEGVARGACVEVGANDGVNDSNTYHFELQGWHCVLVEPNADLCRQIRVARKAVLHECAASASEGVATLNVADGAERSHGVSTINGDPTALDKIRSYGFVPRPVEVRMRTLDAMLAESAVEPGFEFITIDVEGHEQEVLKGFSLEKWRPVVVIVEDNSYFRDRAVADHLQRHGYLPFLRTGVNDWFAPASNTSLLTARRRWLYRFISIAVRAKRSRLATPLRALYGWSRKPRRGTAGK